MKPSSKGLTLEDRLKLLQQKYENYKGSEPTIEVSIVPTGTRRDRKTRSRQCNRTSLGSLDANSSGAFRRRLPSLDYDLHKNNLFESMINKRLQINDKITENSQFKSEDMDDLPVPRFDTDLEQVRLQTKSPHE